MISMCKGNLCVNRYIHIQIASYIAKTGTPEPKQSIPMVVCCFFYLDFTEHCCGKMHSFMDKNVHITFHLESARAFALYCTLQA